MSARRIVYRRHAIQRMFQRRIDADEVRRIVESGETIETYPDDRPFPARLVLGHVNDRPLHVVVADDTNEVLDIVVTVYEPSQELWEPGFRRRRKP